MDKIKKHPDSELSKVMENLSDLYDEVVKIEEKEKSHSYTIVKSLLKSAYGWLERKGER